MSGGMEFFVRRETTKEYIKKYPVATALIIVNTLLILLTTFDGGSTNPDTLLKYGAYSKQNILEGEWYRFFTPMFLHIGFLHYFLNTFAIAIFTADIERLFGSVKYLTVYILSGIGGFITVYLFSSTDLGAGASGAIYGILGVYVYMVFSKNYKLGKETKKSILTLTALNIVITLLIPVISTAGHLGGLATGVIIATVLFRRKKLRLVERS